MINDRITTLRNKLNNMVSDEADYNDIYTVSLELDELIVEYYTHNYVGGFTKNFCYKEVIKNN